MSLMLNGAKTMTIAGTEMQCLEIYTGEAYTLPLSFTDNQGNPANASIPAPWTLDVYAKFYSLTDVSYLNEDSVVLGNLTLLPIQPLANAYTLQSDWSNIDAGLGYLYVGADITNSGNNTPNIDLANTTANSTMVLVTLEVTRQSEANASLDNINREPLGFIVRYQ